MYFLHNGGKREGEKPFKGIQSELQRQTAQIKADSQEWDRQHWRCTIRLAPGMMTSPAGLKRLLTSTAFFYRQHWQKSKCAERKGLFVLDAGNHPLNWQPCRHCSGNKRQRLCPGECLLGSFQRFAFTPVNHAISRLLYTPSAEWEQKSKKVDRPAT